uniref:Uncharacterized protein n=1 Tax=Triticum urartu TaxID=4572 RepID=A0A8R7TMM2_TRIUA
MLYQQTIEQEWPAGIAAPRRREDVHEADRRGPNAVLQHAHEHLQGFIGTPRLDVPAKEGVPRNDVLLGHCVEQPADDVDAAVAVPRAGGVEVEQRVAEDGGVRERASAAEEVRVYGPPEAQAAGAGAGGERARVGVVVGAGRGARGVVEERVEAERVVRERGGDVGDEEHVAEQRRRRARQRVQQQPPRLLEPPLLAELLHLRHRQLRPALASAGGIGGIGGGGRRRDGALRRSHGVVSLLLAALAHLLIPCDCD